MEPFTCTTCWARVVPPPIDLDALGLQLRRCTSCRALLSWDAFAHAAAREAARRCTSCANGPNALAHWHQHDLAPAQPEPDTREQSMALVAEKMGPPPPVAPPRAERGHGRQRRIRNRVQMRRRKKHAKERE
ncbi:hypothetical protein PHYPSEUDO_009708 [Phytophthora pseudosyringae]|uniref:Uncharacterized protein n=1 Tax=Phytophthora pseudosyringae TaxID=221518 RepID=A0A8T1WAM9_9STRA|nr:hypothetical protein PHYPSEUDO_009708 [Phytophthora pseudosyringae]